MIEFVDALPRNHAGKVTKNDLRDAWLARHPQGANFQMNTARHITSQPPAPATGPKTSPELAQRRAIAHALGGEEQVARHHAPGKLTARERIDHLLDAGSFNEIGALAGGVKYGADRKRQIFTPLELRGIRR